MQVNLESSHDSITTTPNCSKLETNDDYHLYFSLFPSFPLSVTHGSLIHHQKMSLGTAATQDR